MIRVAIPGCAGQMGRALIRAIAATPDLKLAAAAEVPGSPALGQDAGLVAGLPPLGVTVTAELNQLLEGTDGIIDFTQADATVTLSSHCAEQRIPLIVGTTGLSEPQRAALLRCAGSIPIVLAPNMSVGVNVLLRLAAQAAELLGPDFELEIIEAHHNRKVDAPSGTALRLAEVLAEATQAAGPIEERRCYGRQGAVGPRRREEIGIHAVRGGDIVGEHTVMYCGAGERLELIHRATSRQTFAQGALRALRWALDRDTPGLYDMQDVLGLR